MADDSDFAINDFDEIDLDEEAKKIESMPLTELKSFASLAMKGYVRERARRRELDEECDLLATEIDRLQTELNTVRETHIPRRPPKGLSKELSADSSVLSSPIIFAEVDWKYPNTLYKRFEGACSEKNVICVGIAHSSVLGESSSSNKSQNSYLIICGGADSYLSCYLYNVDDECRSVCKDNSSSSSSSSGGNGDISSSSSSTVNEIPLFRVAMPSAVLSIDIWGSFVAVSSMDGSHMVLDLSLDFKNEQFIISREKKHTKYVVRTRWSRDGNLLCTVSHDKSITIFKKVSPSVEGASVTFEQIKKLNFLTTPEDAIFVPSSNPASSSADSTELVVALRDSNSLVYINCDEDRNEIGTYKVSQRTVSMNERDWDSHVSFNALLLTSSPDSKFLLVSNDKHMHILFILGTNVRVRLFNDHDCGDYGKPRVAFDPSGSFIYSNCENSKDIYVYSVASGKLLQTLTGHSGQVKDIVFNSDQNRRFFVSGGFDKSVIVWK